MTLQGLKKTLTAGSASTAIAVALVLGFGPATAHADVIDDLAQEFSTAAGAGQVSNLLNQSMRLRAMGFRPTKGEITSIQDALNYRPNQTPLIRALQDTVAGQQKLKQRADATGQQPFTIGVNQYDPNNPGGVGVGPGGVQIGGGSGSYTIGDGGAGTVPGGG
jgi:hypothetical protein